MNELMKFEGQSTGTMSSREIAELTGKNHADVLRDLRKLNESYDKLHLSKIALLFSTRELANGGAVKDKYFELTKIQTFDLMTGYNTELRIKVNRRWAELEAKQLPQTRKEWIKLALAQEEALEQAALHIDNLETALDTLVEWVSIIKVAKHNNTHENRFNWRKLKQKSIELGFSIKKAESPRFGYQNLYHTSVFKLCYPRFKYDFIEK